MSPEPETPSHRYFVTYSGVKLPLKLIDPLEESELNNRNTFMRAFYDADGRLLGCERISYGQVELSHRYSYDEAGVLRRAVIESDGDATTLEFDDSGSARPRHGE